MTSRTSTSRRGVASDCMWRIGFSLMMSYAVIIPTTEPRVSSIAKALRTPVCFMCSSAASMFAFSAIVTDARSRKSVMTDRAGSPGSANQGSSPGIGRLVPVT